MISSEDPDSSLRGPQGEGSATIYLIQREPRPASPVYAEAHEEAPASGQPTLDPNGKCPAHTVEEIREALADMYQCFRAAKIPVHSAPLDQPPTPWRLFARKFERLLVCLLYTSPSPRDGLLSRMPSSA